LGISSVELFTQIREGQLTDASSATVAVCRKTAPSAPPSVLENLSAYMNINSSRVCA